MTDDLTFEARVRALAADATALPAPADAWQQIAARIESGDEVLLPAGDAANDSAAAGDRAAPATAAIPAVRAGARRAARHARAAAIVLLTGALGAAAALPASPVRAWLEALVGGGSQSALSQPTTTPADAGAAAAADPHGESAGTLLIIDPVQGDAVVALTEPAAGVRIRVRFSDEPGIEVHALGGVAGAQFRSALGQLTIAEAAAGDLVLTVPNGLRRLTVLVDGIAYLTIRDGAIRIHSPAADTVGSEILLPVIR